MRKIGEEDGGEERGKWNKLFGRFEFSLRSFSLEGGRGKKYEQSNLNE